MNVTNEKAQESLSAVENIRSQTRKSIAAKDAYPLLILWGVIWIVCFLGTHFFLKWVNEIWFGICGLGSIATILICKWQFRTANPTKIPSTDKIGWRIFWFWLLLFIYSFLLLSIIQPKNGIQFNAFLCTVIMFAYIVIGLWFKSNIMIGLGLAVTITTMIGVHLISPTYYCLWMAATGGGALLGTGLYLWLRWR